MASLYERFVLCWWRLGVRCA